MTLSDFVQAYDWINAFDAADVEASYGYTLADVVRIVASDDGEKESLPWIGVFEMKDGKFLYVMAGCDYTGWDCIAHGTALLRDSEEACFDPLTMEEAHRIRLRRDESRA